MVVVSIFHYFKQPPISGFIISGALIGPHALGWIKDQELVQLLSEIGVVFLLFSLGIEFSLKTILRLRKAFFLLGGLSCLISAGLVAGIALTFGTTVSKAVVLGALACLSSTAVVLKLLQERRETSSTHGNLAVAVLLFQDLLAVPLVLLLPLLGAKSAEAMPSPALLAMTIGKILLLVVALIAGARYAVPFILKSLARTQVRELLIIGVSVLSLGSAWISHEIGLSLALGAFIAGLLISESEYGTQAFSDIIPFRDIFIAVFFVSIGMQLDFVFLEQNGLQVLGLAIGIILVKFIAITFVGSLLNYEARISVMVALILAQVGEFSFVLAMKAYSDGLLNATEFQYFLSVSIIVLMITPIMIRMAPHVAPRIADFDVMKKVTGPLRKVPGWPNSNVKSTEAIPKAELTNHVIIVGFGLNGQNLAKVLDANSIPFSVIEFNPETVRHWKDRGLSIHFGDASKREVLEHAGLLKSRIVVVAISDSQWVKNVVASIRAIRSDIQVMVRCQYLRDMETLKDSGITDVVIAEIETASRIFARVLFHYGVPEAEIDRHVKEVEEENYRRVHH